MDLPPLSHKFFSGSTGFLEASKDWFKKETLVAVLWGFSVSLPFKAGKTERETTVCQELRSTMVLLKLSVIVHESHKL